jgi:hypothetical protein
MTWLLLKVLPASKMPVTVMVVLYAVNVDPTFKLFLSASVLPISATLSLLVLLKTLPDFRVKVPPPPGPPEVRSVGLVVPLTVIGGVKLIVAWPSLL